MFQFQNIWFPDGEKHFPEWMARNGEIVNGKGTYQIKKLREAMKHVKQFRRAIDVGAHVGLWSMHLQPRFEFLDAFEPVREFRECWILNMQGRTSSCYLSDVALGAAVGRIAMRVNWADTGGTFAVSAEGVDPIHTVQMKPLDLYSFQELDFIKIDCEGYELEVLKGATETLKRCKPCVIVEQKPHKLLPNFGIKGTPAVDYLRSMGAVLRKEMGGDFIMSWDA